MLAHVWIRVYYISSTVAYFPISSALHTLQYRRKDTSPVQLKNYVPVFKDRISDRDREKMHREKNYIDRDRVRDRDAK